MFKVSLLTLSAVLISMAGPAAAAPAPAGAPQLAQNSPTPAIEQVTSNGADAVRPVAGGTAAAAPEKKVCKLLESSYSHRSQRVCLTKKEWQQVDSEAQ
jgi:hypothetical protein